MILVILTWVLLSLLINVFIVVWIQKCNGCGLLRRRGGGGKWYVYRLESKNWVYKNVYQPLLLERRRREIQLLRPGRHLWRTLTCLHTLHSRPPRTDWGGHTNPRPYFVPVRHITDLSPFHPGTSLSSTEVRMGREIVHQLGGFSSVNRNDSESKE